MSSTLSNIQLGTSVATLDGLSVINADQLFVDGQNVNPSAPNIPVNPTSLNSTYAIIFTDSFGVQSSAPLFVDATFGLGYNPSTDMLYTQNLYTNGSIYTGGLVVGTPVYTIGINSSQQLVKYTPTITVPNLFNISASSSSVIYYLPLLSSNSGGNQAIYSDTTSGTIRYQSNTKTLIVDKLQLTTTPAGTQSSLLAIDSAGNVILGSSTPTQLLTSQTSVSTTYYPTFVASQTTGNKSYYVPYPAGGYDVRYVSNASLGGIGTLYVPQLAIETSVALPDLCSFITPPATSLISSISYALGLDSSNNIRKFVPSNQTSISTTSANAAYNLLFTSSSTAGIATVSIDTGLNITYNPSTDTLTVPILTVGTSATIAGASLTGTPVAPTAASGTNTTQIATTAFVQTAVSGVSGYLPLTGGTMSGTISFASGTNNLLSMYYNKFNQYTNYIIDSGGNQYIAITTDAPSASPSPLVGYIQLVRNTAITGTLSCSSNLASSGTTVSTGKITGNAGMTITNGGITYANIGLSGFNTLYAETYFYDLLSHAVMQVSYSSGVNHNIASTTSYNWQLTNGGSTTCFNLSLTQAAYRLGSMFDFSVAGTWDNSNALFITTGGNGGTNKGVGIGYNTTLDSGLLVSVTPSISWKKMTYKADSHVFQIINTTVLTVASNGISIVGTVYTNAIYNNLDPYLNLTSQYITFNASSGGYSQFASTSTTTVWAGYNSGNFVGALYYQTGGYFGSNHLQVSNHVSTSGSVSNGAGVFIKNGQNGYGFDYWTYGYGASGANTSVFVISNYTGTGVSFAAGSTSWGAYSDRRCKKNLRCIGDGHKNLMRLKPVHYHYLTDEKLFPDRLHRHGFVAQEFAEVYPQHVCHNNPPFKDVDDTEIENPMSIHMVEIIPDMVDSIQYLTLKAQRHKDRIIVLEDTVKMQQGQIDLLLTHVAKLTDQVNELTKKII